MQLGYLGLSYATGKIREDRGQIESCPVAASSGSYIFHLISRPSSESQLMRRFKVWAERQRNYSFTMLDKDIMST
jgi:hypothetical protein